VVRDLETDFFGLVSPWPFVLFNADCWSFKLAFVLQTAGTWLKTDKKRILFSIILYTFLNGTFREILKVIIYQLGDTNQLIEVYFHLIIHGTEFTK
jgi:hypothetical protein